MNIQLSKAPPSPQQTIDIFKGAWASSFPPHAQVSAGSAGLFEDPRVDWVQTHLRKLGIELSTCSVLELGPLEGGHTYLLSKTGAPSVTAIEANSQAYLKCLVAKELLGIERVNFLYGDAVSYMKTTPRVFDLGFVCGFLYHLTNPVEAIQLLSLRCRSIFLWTVYWDPNFTLAENPSAGAQGPVRESEFQGFKHKLHLHDYGELADKTGFWGGNENYTCWLELDGILGALRFFGFDEPIYEIDKTPFGLAVKLVAKKKPGI